MKLPIICESLSHAFEQNGLRGTGSTFGETKNTYKASVRYMKQEISGRPSVNGSVWTLSGSWVRQVTSCFGHANEPSGSIKCGEHIDWDKHSFRILLSLNGSFLPTFRDNASDPWRLDWQFVPKCLLETTILRLVKSQRAQISCIPWRKSEVTLILDWLRKCEFLKVFAERNQLLS